MNSSDSELSDDADLKNILAEYKTQAPSPSPPPPPSPPSPPPLPPPSTADAENDKRNECKVTAEMAMERVVFNDRETLIAKLAEAANDSNGEDDGEACGRERGTSTSEENASGVRKRKPVWEDEDDDNNHEVVLITNRKGRRLPRGKVGVLDGTYKVKRAQDFTRIHAQPKWADLNRVKRRTGSDDDDDDNLLHTVGFLAKATSSESLPPTNIVYGRRGFLFQANTAKNCVTNICFHPTSTAAMVASTSGVAAIYAVDGKSNERLHSICFQKFPISCARITPCGTKAFFGAKRAHYYSYDLLAATEMIHALTDHRGLQHFDISPCGRFLAGRSSLRCVYLFDAHSKELVHTFKQEERVAGIRFTWDSQRIVCSSEGPSVSIFNLRTQRLEHSFIDDGCIVGQSVDVAPNQRLLAIGSSEGVTNIYDFDEVLLSKAPKPKKAILNLRTSIGGVAFNHSSEMLATWSPKLDNAIKLVQLPTATVFANFPFRTAAHGLIHCASFSPGSGYMALGGTKSHVALYRLRHYKNY